MLREDRGFWVIGVLAARQGTDEESLRYSWVHGSGDLPEQGVQWPRRRVQRGGYPLHDAQWVPAVQGQGDKNDREEDVLGKDKVWEGVTGEDLRRDQGADLADGGEKRW